MLTSWWNEINHFLKETVQRKIITLPELGVKSTFDSY